MSGMDSPISDFDDTDSSLLAVCPKPEETSHIEHKSNLRKFRSSSFLFSSRPATRRDEFMMMKPYVIHRLLNQRARMKAPPPEPCTTPPPVVRREWEPDSDEYDTELEDEIEEKEKQKQQGESGYHFRLCGDLERVFLSQIVSGYHTLYSPEQQTWNALTNRSVLLRECLRSVVEWCQSSWI